MPFCQCSLLPECNSCSFVYNCDFIELLIINHRGQGVFVRFLCVYKRQKSPSKNHRLYHTYTQLWCCPLLDYCIVSVQQTPMGQLSWLHVNSTDEIISRLTIRGGGKKKTSLLLTLKPTMSTLRLTLNSVTLPVNVCVCVCVVIPGVGQITDQSALTHSPGILTPSASAWRPSSAGTHPHLALFECTTWPHYLTTVSLVPHACCSLPPSRTTVRVGGGGRFVSIMTGRRLLKCEWTSGGSADISSMGTQ